MDGMEPDKPSLLRRVLAVVVIGIVAVIALRIAFGVVAGLVTAALWVIVLVALVGAVLWARSTLKSSKASKAAKAAEPERQVSRAQDHALPAAPVDDAVAAEMARITQQLKEQGRR